jgi:hypothetical protein
MNPYQPLLDASISMFDAMRTVLEAHHPMTDEQFTSLRNLGQALVAVGLAFELITTAPTPENVH